MMRLSIASPVRSIRKRQARRVNHPAGVEKRDRETDKRKQHRIARYTGRQNQESYLYSVPSLSLSQICS